MISSAATTLLVQPLTEAEHACKLLCVHPKEVFLILAIIAMDPMIFSVAPVVATVQEVTANLVHAAPLRISRMWLIGVRDFRDGIRLPANASSKRNLA
eukprot:gene33470-41303_t